LFRRLIAEAEGRRYDKLRITTGYSNVAMRALAQKFGAHLTFRHGESTGIIDLTQQTQIEPAKSSEMPVFAAAREIVRFNRAWWKMLLGSSGWGRAA
jgi:hypothetical protein